MSFERMAGAGEEDRLRWQTGAASLAADLLTGAPMPSPGPVAGDPVGGISLAPVRSARKVIGAASVASGSSITTAMRIDTREMHLIVNLHCARATVGFLYNEATGKIKNAKRAIGVPFPESQLSLAFAEYPCQAARETVKNC